MRVITIQLADGEFLDLESLAAKRDTTVDDLATYCLKIGFLGIGMLTREEA